MHYPRKSNRPWGTGVTGPPWSWKRLSGLQRLKRSPPNPLLRTPDDTRTSKIFRCKGIFVISHNNFFCFYSFNWKIIPTENVQSSHRKRCLARTAQHLEAVKIFSHFQNICNPQRSFGSHSSTRFPVTTQEKGTFPPTLQCKAIVLGRNE